MGATIAEPSARGGPATCDATAAAPTPVAEAEKEPRDGERLDRVSVAWDELSVDLSVGRVLQDVEAVLLTVDGVGDRDKLQLLLWDELSVDLSVGCIAAELRLQLWEKL